MNKIFNLNVLILIGWVTFLNLNLMAQEGSRVNNLANDLGQGQVINEPHESILGDQDYTPLLGETVDFDVHGIIWDTLILYLMPQGEAPAGMTVGMQFSMFVAQAHKIGLGAYWSSFSEDEYLTVPDYGYEMKGGFIYNYLIGIKFLAIQMGLKLGGSLFTMQPTANAATLTKNLTRQLSYIYVYIAPEITLSFRIFERFAFSIPVNYQLYFGGTTGDAYDLTHISTGVMFTWMELDLWL